MSQASISLLALTVIASAAVAANRLVTQAGAYPEAAGGLAFGVTRSDGAIGDPIPVDVHGTAIVETGGAINADTPVMVEALTGKVIAHDLDGDKHAVGRAIGSSAGAGQFIEILLIPSAGVLVTAA